MGIAPALVSAHVSLIEVVAPGLHHCGIAGYCTRALPSGADQQIWTGRGNWWSWWPYLSANKVASVRFGIVAGGNRQWCKA